MSERDDYNNYLFEYRFDGSVWGIQIVARSPHEAKERLKALAWAKYQGEVMATIPVPKFSFLRRLFMCFNKESGR